MAFIPTLCEVSYDSDFLERDSYSTPYRIPQLSSLGKTHCGGTIAREHGTFGFDRLSVHSRNTAPSYYDYLRSYYLEQSCSPSTYGGSIPSPSLPSRSQTTFAWYVPISEDASPAGYRENHRDLSLPSLLKSPTPGEERGEWPQREGEGGRLVWVDALNSWVPKKGEGEGRRRRAACGRFQNHMQNFLSESSCRVGHINLKRAAALQKKPSPSKSADTSSRKQNRKAYSTPLSNAESRRKHVVQFQRPLTPDVVIETHPASLEAVQAAWVSPDSLEGEEQVKEEVEVDMGERLELQVPEAETEAVDNGQAVDTEQAGGDSEETGKSEASHSPDYQPIPPMFLTPSPPLLPTLRAASPVHQGRESSVTSRASSETVDTVPTLPSVSIQYLVSEPHQHAKAVHFPVIVATDIVEIEPVSGSVPYRIRRLAEQEEETGTGIWMVQRQHRRLRGSTGRAKGRTMDVVEIQASVQTPPDKPDVRLAQPDSHLSRKHPKPPSRPPPRPPPVSKTKTQEKKISPRKPVMSKPSKSPTKTSTTIPKASKTPQRQKPAKSTSKHKKATKTSPSKPVKLDKAPSSCKSSQDQDRPQPLPVSLPVVTAHPPPPSPSPSPSPEPPRDNLVQPEDTVLLDKESVTKPKGRSQVKKRERVVNRRKCKTEEVSTDTELPEFQVKTSDWIYGKEEPETQTEKQDAIDVKVEKPVLPPVVPDLPSSSSQSAVNRIQKKLQAFRQPIDNKKRWGPKKRDTSYEDELRKQELAEARRKRQADMLERLKKKRSGQTMEEDGITGIPSFEDYGFLAKYCILTRANLEMYKHAFQAVDDERRGWLNGTEAMIALRGTNTSLTETEEEYLYRILELTGYSVTNGADFKLFSVLAALSQRIASLDHWMKNLIGRVDFKTLEMKMFMCKSLWECNVDPNTNKISLDQLMIELRAGGVSYEHECEVRHKLGHLKALDLLDFLTYIPLFIMIHESVVDNPLDDTREK